MARIDRRKDAKFNYKPENTPAEAEVPRWLIDYNFMQTKELQAKPLILKSAVKKYKK